MEHSFTLESASKAIHGRLSVGEISELVLRSSTYVNGAFTLDPLKLVAEISHAVELKLEHEFAQTTAVLRSQLAHTNDELTSLQTEVTTLVKPVELFDDATKAQMARVILETGGTTSQLLEASKFLAAKAEEAAP